MRPINMPWSSGSVEDGRSGSQVSGRPIPDAGPAPTRPVSYSPAGWTNVFHRCDPGDHENRASRMISSTNTAHRRGLGFAALPDTPGTHGSLRRHLMQGASGRDTSMNICCPRCGGLAEPAGHEDARAFFQCPTCSRVWATHISASATHSFPTVNAPRVLIADDSREMLG